MKKLFSLFIVLCFGIGTIACAPNNPTTVKLPTSTSTPIPTPTPTPAPTPVDVLPIAKEAYANLSKAYGMVDELGTDLYTAWHFSQSSRGEYFTGDRIEEGIENFAEDMAMDVSVLKSKYIEVVNARNEATNGIYGYDWLYKHGTSLGSVCVDVIRGFSAEKTNDIDMLLKKSATGIKNISSTDANVNYLNDLKELYSKIELYYELVVSVDGDFANSKENTYKKFASDIEEHQEGIKTYINRLSFDLE